MINPTTLAVSRTIGLPFASQPYGIIAAPTGNAMFVALEGTGRVLKIDVGYRQYARQHQCRAQCPPPLDVG